jgi:hypothetical protein
MANRKTIDLLSVSSSERTKLVWKIRRQIQQKALEEKLVNALSRSCADLPYPEVMDPFVKDFARKAENEIRRNEVCDPVHEPLKKR